MSNECRGNKPFLLGYIDRRLLIASYTFSVMANTHTTNERTHTHTLQNENYDKIYSIWFVSPTMLNKFVARLDWWWQMMTNKTKNEIFLHIFNQVGCVTQFGILYNFCKKKNLQQRQFYQHFFEIILINWIPFFPFLFPSICFHAFRLVNDFRDTDHSTNDGNRLLFVTSQKGKCQLVHNGYCYVQEKLVKDKVYWRCICYTSKLHCHARIHTMGDDVVRSTPHCHPPDIPRKKFAFIQWIFAIKTGKFANLTRINLELYWVNPFGNNPSWKQKKLDATTPWIGNENKNKTNIKKYTKILKCKTKWMFWMRICISPILHPKKKMLHSSQFRLIC